ncbi:MAG: ASKHA domain-containing protein [Eubacteriales bacterium]|nr:ASKHA domain-containing protein [Eubacteriales bacterium]
MSDLTILSGNKKSVYHFEGSMNLAKALSDAGYPLVQPCGGRGVCGKCAVEVSGCISEPDIQEQKLGVRLACRTVLFGDAAVVLPNSGDMQQIETGGSVKTETVDPLGSGFGVAIDIGTTTVAAKLLNLASGREISSAARINPQTSVASDVMGRIGAALSGELESLKKLIADALSEMLAELCAGAGIRQEEISCLVVTGNTTMLYLLTGKNPEALSHFPFEADCLFGYETDFLGYRTYLPACMNAFVGADITCAVLASGMTNRAETSLLCDIGTNGEIALWKDGTLYVTSTAAGPAFEGAGISCGCGSIPGAIDRVSLEDGMVTVHTIGDAPAVGLCGSGLIDTIACFLKTGGIDETGAVDEDFLPLSNGVVLMPKDVRSVQLAKAAIAAGIITLMENAGVQTEEISTLYIAGGFGSHLNVESAAAIGLIPEALSDRVSVIGNGALTGAEQMLLNKGMIQDGERIVQLSRHINLGGNPQFNNNYMEQMLFPEQ